MESSAQTPATASTGSRLLMTTTDRIRRGAPAALAGIVALGMLLVLAFRSGGYFPEQHLGPGAVAFAALAVLLAVRPPEFTVSTPALVALAALIGLALWTALSSHWSSAPAVALEDFQRDLVYVGLFGLGLLAAGSGRYSRHLVWAVLGLILTVVGAGLMSRLYPQALDASTAITEFSGWRLGYPLEYWNAFGAMGAMGVVLAVGLAADPRANVILRAAAAAASIPIGTAAYLSFSRGAWLAFFVGVAVLLVLGAHRWSLLITLGICGLALVAAIGRLAEFDVITDGPAGEQLAEEGRAYAPFLLGLAALAAVGQTLASGWWLPAPTREMLARARRPLTIVVIGAGVLFACAAYLLRPGDVEGATAARLVSIENWADRQWDEFMTPTTFTGTSGAERLTTARGTRSDLYRVAIDGFETHPFRGDGAGAFEYRFAHDRDVAEKVRDAHSLYLETAGELGVVGVALLLGFLAALATAAIRARLRGGTMTGAQSGAAASAVAVWATHAGVDWDWQVPALTGTALVLGAAVFPVGRGRRRRRSRGDLGEPSRWRAPVIGDRTPGSSRGR